MPLEDEPVLLSGPAGTRTSRRSGSKNRQRQKLVGVRLSDEEHALLLAAAKRQNVSPASVLRYTFLATYTAQNAGPALGGGAKVAVVRPEGCICVEFLDTGGFRIAAVCCPVHGVGGADPGDGYWEREDEGP
jgi:hypothetical protein